MMEKISLVSRPLCPGKPSPHDETCPRVHAEAGVSAGQPLAGQAERGGLRLGCLPASGHLCEGFCSPNWANRTPQP